MAKFLDITGLTYFWEKIESKLKAEGGITVDSTLSSDSTNPVQNKVVNNALAEKISVGAVGAANGVAELDENGKVLSSQLPSYVDDVIEAASESNFPTAGEAGKIYVDLSTNKTYRWSGSTYVEISSSLAIGETSTTAGRGDWTKTAYDHSQEAHAPSNAEANVQSDWNATDTTSDAYIKNKPVSLPANGGNADTVNGHTVGSDVPANAKFTDTVYTLPIAGSSLGGVKTTSNVTSASGHTPCPIIDGVPYYKDTDTVATAITTAEIDAIFS